MFSRPHDADTSEAGTPSSAPSSRPSSSMSEANMTPQQLPRKRRAGGDENFQEVLVHMEKQRKEELTSFMKSMAEQQSQLMTTFMGGMTKMFSQAMAAVNAPSTPSTSNTFQTQPMTPHVPNYAPYCQQPTYTNPIPQQLTTPNTNTWTATSTPTGDTLQNANMAPPNRFHAPEETD